MAIGRRKVERQADFWVSTASLPVSPGHPFYEQLNQVLAGAGFDRFCEESCRKFYHATLGRPSVPPGVYFRMLLVGYFEKLPSERQIAWRCADSLSLRAFLGLAPGDGSPDMWVPSTDLRQGRTFPVNQPAREAYYDGAQQACVFDSACGACGLSNVNGAYGGWDHEARVGQGGLVVSAATMLQLAQRYSVASGAAGIGSELSEPVSGSHGGSLEGVNCRIRQRSDGINAFVWFNERSGDEEVGNYAALLLEQITPFLDSQTTWPTLAIDGFWVQDGPTFPVSVFGSYSKPFNSLSEALSNVSDGSRVSFKPGPHPFSGTISTKTMLRAPLGPAQIGD